jgi:dipeptidyl aminopeptidase/acylaminoacyl peptidase
MACALFNADDLHRHRRIGPLHLCAVRDAAVCSVRSVDRAGDRYLQQLWEFPLGNGDPPRALTDGSCRDATPRWSPDARSIAFLSDRDGGAMQLHLLPVVGDIDAGGYGIARRVGNFAQGVVQCDWLPDGRALIATVALAVDPDQRGARSAQPPARRGQNTPKIAWRLPYKADAVGYLLQREIHLVSIDAQTGDHVQLTDGAFDVLFFAAAPDSGCIAYVRMREGRTANRSDLWIYDIESRSHRCVCDRVATVDAPVWSPDGTRIAFGGSAFEGESETALWVVDVSSGAVDEVCAGAVDVALADAIGWSADSARLRFVQAHRGRHRVVELTLADGSIRVLVTGDRQFGAFAAGPGRLVYSVDHPSQANELWTSDGDGANERRISRLNAWWDERRAVDVQARSFLVPDGDGGTESIDGWLLRRADAALPAPLLDEIHGGPAAYAMLDFDGNVHWQSLCAQGWQVLLLNAVGSATFGRGFCARLSGRWGALDLPQHLAVLAQLRAEGVCDDRVAVMGKSYGGYFSAWAAGHTDAYRAAVVVSPVGNLESHYGTSDGGYQTDPVYTTGRADFDRETARAMSPVAAIGTSRTPTLFLQGEADERCPKGQSEELFVALCRGGDTPTELVLYPGGSHSFAATGEPSGREDVVRRIAGWLERHVLTQPAAAPAAEAV